MKSPVVAGVLVLIILGSVVWLFSYYASQPEPGEPIAHLMPAICASCGKSFPAMIGKQPAKCPSCGEVALWRAFKCTNPDCGVLFAYKGAQESLGAERDIACPKCGGHHYRTEIAKDELGEP